MKSLFFRIFLWFWVAIAVLSATLVISAALLRSSSTDRLRWRQRNELILDLRAQRESELLDRQGVAAVLSELGTLEQSDSPRTYIFDEDEHEILKQTISPQIRSVLSMLSQSGQGGPQLFADGSIGGEKVAGPSGRAYFFILSFPARPMLPRSVSRVLLEEVGSQGIFYLLAVLAIAGFYSSTRSYPRVSSVHTAYQL